MAKGGYITPFPMTVPGCVGWMDAADTSTDNITSIGGMDVGNITVNQIAIGALLRLTADQFFNGIIGEFIMYNMALSDQNRIAIQRYLGNKWGIAVS